MKQYQSPSSAGGLILFHSRHPELQSKCWARGYYVEIIGNITDEEVQKYIKERAVTMPLLREKIKTPVELVVDDLDVLYYYL